ncbi:radical SAM protein [Prauserella oleivorans]
MITSTATTGRASARRRVGCGTRGGTGVVYDPLTGLTHRTGEPTLTGRATLANESIAALPEVHPGGLGDVMPVSVCWSPIVRCNLACPHCLDDKSVPELGRGGRAEVAARIAASGVLGVDVSGGEPLLIRDLPTLLDVLVDGGCAVSVTTNGTHLPRRAEALARRVDAIRVSLDGPDPQRHDRWRGEEVSPRPSPASAPPLPTASPPRSRLCSCAPPPLVCPRWSSWPTGSASTA